MKILTNIGVLLATLALLVSGCSAPAEAPMNLEKALPASNAVNGWSIFQAAQTYHRDNLYNLVDGQAESFFAYGFEQVTVQRYQNTAGVRLNIEIWQLASTVDAYGLFTAGRTGQPAEIGNEGNTDPGRRLAFWQNRYFISLYSDQSVPDEELMTFARAISAALPAGGKRPAIVDRLPAAGLAERSGIFFHEEMSIQMEIWLGGENLLKLSQQTDGVIARYEMNGVKARLLLIEYPTEAEATAGLQALQSGSLENLLAAQASGKLLGAVFGEVEAADAEALLAEALR